MVKLRSYVPQMLAEGQWCPNGLRFSKREDAERQARQTFMRWMGCSDSRAVESDDEPTHIMNEDGSYRDLTSDEISALRAALLPTTIVLDGRTFTVGGATDNLIKLRGPRGGESTLVRNQNVPTAWAHITMSGRKARTVWYRRDTDTFTFERTTGISLVMEQVRALREVAS